MDATLNDILMSFRSFFRRRATFEWFVIVIVGLLLRSDTHGVSSFIRCLCICPSLYCNLLHFFRSSACSLDQIMLCWVKALIERVPPLSIGGHILLVGDEIKIARAGRQTPVVKDLHQESQNSNKPKHISGHHFGVISLLIGAAEKICAVPIRAELHDGVKEVREWQGKPLPELGGKIDVTIVTLMLQMAAGICRHLPGSAILVLDAFFATGKTFLYANQVTDANGNRLLHIITRAKKNVVGFLDPAPPTGKQRKRIFGERVRLFQLFRDPAQKFTSAKVKIYGKRKSIAYLCLDLLWKPTKSKIRFVLVKDGKNEFILMCSDLSLSPVDIIRAYGYRFKIEVTFKSLKHLIGGFCYHFWTEAIPKSRQKNRVDLAQITNVQDQRNIALTVNAVENFVNYSCIALGILQLLSVTQPGLIWGNYRGWLRTFSSNIPSEEVTLSVLRACLYSHRYTCRSKGIFGIIWSKRRTQNAETYPDAA